MGRRLVTALLVVLFAGCAPGASQVALERASVERDMARGVWLQCVNDPGCVGDEMFKYKSQLDYAELKYWQERQLTQHMYARVPELPSWIRY